MTQIKNDRLAPFLSRVWQSQKAITAVWLGVILYTAFFTSISFQRYEAFSYSDFDFAIFVHLSWKGLHGSGNISILNDVPVWGDTLQLISFLTLPIYLLFGSDPRALLFGQAFILGAGAIPIFLIARKRMPELMAASLAFSYLLHPAVWFCNLYEYYPVVYATFTLLMAFYFFDQNRFGWFMVFILLSLVNRVDLGIVTAMYGVYALFLKRGWKWVLSPFLLSVVWVYVGLFVLIPQFSTNNNVAYDSYYSHFGKGFGEIIRNMVLHPEILWKHLVTAENGKYFVEMLFPVCFLSLAGLREFSICALSLVQHLASNRATEHTITYHYTSTITPFVYISAIHGLEWIKKRRDLHWIFCLLPLILSLYALFSYGPLQKTQDYLNDLKIDAEDVYKKKLLREIPAGVPVVSTFEFAPMLSGRERYYSFHFIFNGYFLNKRPYETPSDVEYALINFDDERLLSFQHKDSSENIKKFVAGGPFGIVDRINGIVLFKKGYQSDLKLFDVLPADPQAPVLLDIEKNIKLVKADYQMTQKRGQPVLSMILHWTLASPVANQLSTYILIANEKGDIVHAAPREICFNAMPTNRWKPGEEYVDYYDLLLPSSLPKGDYLLFLAVYISGTSKFLKINKHDDKGQIVDSNDSVIIHQFRY